jgi:Protein of unknown function (DUF2934)
MSERNMRPSREEIARRAYEIYVSRGRKNGGDIDDWLTAEQELRGQQSSSSQTKKPALIVTGTVTEQTPQPEVRENAARENTVRENAVRENETHFKLPRHFSATNP